MNVVASADGSPGAVAVVDLSFRYGRGADELFGGPTHSFTTASVTALTGPSGRGKSTLLYVVGLLLAPTRGAVWINGRRVDDVPDVEKSAVRAGHMGFVFQDAVLDPSRRVLDVVCEPAAYSGARRSDVRDRATALLEALDVAHRAGHRPGEISGGQAQRVAVARALVNDPEVILADEPTGNLDRENGDRVLVALEDAARAGRTVIIATHDPSVVERADDVLEL